MNQFTHTSSDPQPPPDSLSASFFFPCRNIPPRYIYPYPWPHPIFSLAVPSSSSTSSSSLSPPSFSFFFFSFYCPSSTHRHDNHRFFVRALLSIVTLPVLITSSSSTPPSSNPSSTMEAPLEHLTFEHRKTPELMDPSSVYTYDSYSGLEYMGFPNSPTAIGAIGRKFFLFASDPASVLTMICFRFSSRRLRSLSPLGLDAHRCGISVLHLWWLLRRYPLPSLHSLKWCVPRRSRQPQPRRAVFG